ncbi:MAG: hypothetical protein BWK73_46350 [Thiothrix lacustris]|uniref:DNA-binding protein n=1 Tax=Thiothrix lacustris TaxID=525917 RepID=A0A1Y1QAM4_9GAMM|nr:MAG: hypothetical protein BWK73_46350 [Thiothrix lacustris]
MTDKTVTPLTGSTSQDVGGASYTLVGKFPERFYRRREVCEMLAIASSTLTDYVKQGVVGQTCILA